MASESVSQAEAAKQLSANQEDVYIDVRSEQERSKTEGALTR